MILSGCQDLHFADPVVEAAGGFAQSGLGIHLSVSGKVDQGEQNISEFTGKSGALGSGLGKFPKFLPNLGRNTLFGVGPIKTGPGCPPLEVLGVEQGGEPLGNPVQTALARRFFLLLQLVPASENLGGIPEFFPAKDMRMAAHELFGQFPGHGLKIESFSFPRQLGVKKNVKKDIAQLLLEGVVITLIDGLEQLVHLLQDHGAEGAMGLFPVPGTTPGTTQSGHDPRQGFGFVHVSALRGPRRFVEPERDE